MESIKDFLDVIPSRDGRRCNQQEQHKTTLCPQADGDEWSEISRNGQELKEIYIYPRMTQMDTDGCPQADGDKWSEISRNEQELKEKIYIHG